MWRQGYRLETVFGGGVMHGNGCVSLADRVYAKWGALGRGGGGKGVGVSGHRLKNDDWEGSLDQLASGTVS